MPQQVVQASFNSGEWSPKLFARVDMAKYRSGAALLSNFFVDYRGGASTRPGTKYILQCYKSGTAVRLIPFQASFAIGYILEFGDKYIRFFFDGAPVLEAATTIASAASGPPEVFTDTAHGYSNGDWIFAGGNYYIIAGKTTNTYTLTDLFGNAINANPFTLPTSAARVYTIVSPYAASDLALVKFAQSVNEMILCHPNYAPQVLTIVSPTNWTIAAITFGATIAAPSAGIGVTTTLSTGTVNYAYVITSVDANGQESSPSTYATLASKQDLSAVAGTNTITWTVVAAASSYNVYKAIVVYGASVAAGALFGYIGNTTSNILNDTNIVADFSITPPINENPFFGSGVQSVAITAQGNYTGLSVPTPSFTGGGGSGAAAIATCAIVSSSLSSSGGGFAVGQTCTTSVPGVFARVLTVGGGDQVTSYCIKRQRSNDVRIAICAVSLVLIQSLATRLSSSMLSGR